MCYVQITNRCNLSCRHCAFSCLDFGDDMSINTFINSCIFYNDFIRNTDDVFCIGGGETALHANIFDFISLCSDNNIKPSLSTNGTVEFVALALADLVDYGLIKNVQLSYTEFHKNQISVVSDKVLERYSLENNPNFIDVNNYSGAVLVSTVDPIIKHGRAVLLDAAVYGCLGSGPYILPNGDVKSCICPTSAKLFNVNSYNSEYVKSLSYSECFGGV